MTADEKAAIIEAIGMATNDDPPVIFSAIEALIDEIRVKAWHSGLSYQNRLSEGKAK